MISQVNDHYFSSSNLSSVMRSINKELLYLAEFPDVKAVILFRIDGQVLESRYCEGISQFLLIVISWVKNIISKTMEELQRGSKSVKYVKRINKSLSIPVYFYRAGNTSIIVTILDSRANTGLMEIEMSRSARRLGWIIDKKESIGE